MDWKLTQQEEISLASAARDEALLSQEAHAYLPKTTDEASKFKPHKWVLEAMRRAYVMGLYAGSLRARAETLAALGMRD